MAYNFRILTDLRLKDLRLTINKTLTQALEISHFKIRFIGKTDR
jgi:hypothetical protein